MKKIVLLFMLLIPNIVLASTHYSDFRKIDYVEEVDNDLIKINEIKLYNTYHKEYIDKGYLEENNELIKDEDDFIEIVENENILFSTNLPGTSEIALSFLDNNIRIYELEVYYEDEKINYTTNSNYYIGQTVNNLKDNDISTYYTHKDSNVFLILYLGDYYDISLLTIKIYTELYDDISVFMEMNGLKKFTLHNNVDRWHIITFNKVTGNAQQYVYSDEIKKLYRYYDLLYEINNEYVPDGDNIILDDYIIKKEYYIRDRLVLKDNIIIDNIDYNIDDYIEFSSDNVTYNCNIDILNNGIYSCDFKLNDIEVSKDVIVSIENNNINKEIINDNLYENDFIVEEDKELSVFDEENDLKNGELDSSLELTGNIEKKEQLIINEESNNLKNDIVVLNNVNEEQSETINEEIVNDDINDLAENNKKIINIIKVFICILFILLDVLAIIKRKKK